MKLLVKNMVCHRCVLAVENILRSEKISFNTIVYGEIDLADEITEEQKLYLGQKLESIGFALIENRNAALVENIKQLVVKIARNETGELDGRVKLSAYISGYINHEYTYLSSLFSSIEGRTIENYFIEQRIEKAKELLVYGQLTLSQIAFDLAYSSVAHLSAQFKKITGLTPTYFREVGVAKRIALDEI